MFHRLISLLGFGWTIRIIAFVALAGLAFSLAVMKIRLPPPKQTRPIFELPALKEPPFLTFCVGLFFMFIGLYFPYFYLPSYFISFLHSDANLAFYSIAIISAASVFGRITPGILADRIGSSNTTVPLCAVASVLAFAWIGIRNEAGTIVFICLYGFISGALVAISPTIVARLTPDMNTVGTRLGMSFVFAGLGLLIGNPIAGALLSLQNAVFWKAQLFCGVMIVTGTAFFAWLRVLKWKEDIAWKA
jgi:predicted MFS family arabinose efflux permease